MWLRTITLLVSCFGAGILAQDDNPYPGLELSEVCLNFVDCGVTDVTPEVKANQKYRMIPQDGNNLFIGGLQEFIRVDPTCSSSETDPWMTKSKKPILSCTGGQGVALDCPGLQDQIPSLICDNYIRTVVKIGADKLLVCGTSYSFPRCYIFDNTCDLDVLDQTADFDGFNGGACADESSLNAGDPYSFVPRNFAGNSSIAYYGSELFIGSSTSIVVGETSGESFVKKIDVAGAISNSGDPFTEDLETYTVKSRSVDDANFVGRPYAYSTDEGDFVLFFYRETAVEHINQGKIVYSRVARVCRDDVGTSASINEAGNWKSYIKARLNCSQPGPPGQYPNYFDEIQDFSVSEQGGETYFYTIFTRPVSGPPQSAMCVFTLTDIHNVFQTSAFKAPGGTTNSLWSSVPSPDPRPAANCDALVDDEDFLTNNLLMNERVENKNFKTDGQLADNSDHPLFISNGVRYSRIVVDDRSNTDRKDDVLFIGTDAGEVWKVTDARVTDSSADSSDCNSGVCFKGLIYWRSATGSPITGLGLITDNSKSYLYATTHEQIIKIDLQYGEAQSQTQFDFIYPPYLMGSLPQVTGAICSNSVEQSVCNGEEVQLTCKGCFDPALGINADTKWMFTPAGGSEIDITASGLGHFIIFNKIRSDAPNPLSYLSVTMHADTSGSYKCVITVGGVDQDSITSTLTAADCTTSTYMTNQGTDFNSAVSDAEANKAQYNMDNEGTVKIECASCDTCPWNNP